MSDIISIVFVLDKSGSMLSSLRPTISGFNEFLESQKKVPGKVTFSLTLFSTEVESIRSENLQDVPPLKADTYIPDGMTALYDAVGMTIEEMGLRFDALPEEEKPHKVLFVIQTDGFENASHRYSRARVRELIKQQTEEWNWEFIFLGAEQNAWEGGAALGLSRGQTFSYNLAATEQAFETLSSVATQYRTTGYTAGNEAVDLRK